MFWPPCSSDTNPCEYFLLGYLKVRVYHTNPHTAQELEAEIEALTEETTGDLLHDS